MSTRSRSPRDTRGGGAVTPGRLAMVALAALGLVLILENTRRVTIRLVVPEVVMPLWLALLGMTVLGGLVGLFAGLLLRRR